jgi:hypothetical protein
MKWINQLNEWRKQCELAIGDFSQLQKEAAKIKDYDLARLYSDAKKENEKRRSDLEQELRSYGYMKFSEI